MVLIFTQYPSGLTAEGWKMPNLIAWALLDYPKFPGIP